VALALRITSVRICNGGVRFCFTDSSLFGSDLVQPMLVVGLLCPFFFPAVQAFPELKLWSWFVTVRSCGGVAGGSEVVKGSVLCWLLCGSLFSSFPAQTELLLLL
jgi:hypothetical protein